MTSFSADSLGNYLPFRLYTESRKGATVAQLAVKYEIAPLWIEQRIEAARLCFEKKVVFTAADPRRPK